jgi:signal transduction histidine kinase
MELIARVKSIGFTGMEVSLLQYLAENKERAISRSELLDKIWGYENEVEKDTAANIIVDESKRLTRLVEDLLYLSRLDSMEENIISTKVKKAVIAHSPFFYGLQICQR